MAPHSSTLAWKIPWMEKPGGLQSMGSGRVGHDWATSLSLFSFMHWRRKWQPTPVFLPGESQGGGAWWAAVSGVTQSRTQLKQLSSSSRSSVLWIYVFSSLGYTPRNEIAQSHGNSVLQFLTNCQLFSKGYFKTFPQAVYNAFSFSTSLLIFLLALAFLMGVKYTLLWFWYAFP